MGTRKSRTPAGKEASPIDAVMELMTERQKYEVWLEELEAKKESTPAKVFERVRKDYLERLQAVMDQMKEHTAAAQEHADNLAAKLKELEDTEDETMETLAESELRAKVGEISEAEWETLQRKTQRELTKLKENQLAIAGDLSKIKELLGGLGKAQPAKQRTTAEINEMEFLKSVVGSAPSAPPLSTPTSTPAVTAPAAPAPTPAPSAATPSAPPAPAPAAAAPATAPIPAPAKPTPSSVPTTTGPLGKAQIADQRKTLKCPECGSMNYPSEWYCERCGAELTVG
jgi:hypothetical protein